MHRDFATIALTLSSCEKAKAIKAGVTILNNYHLNFIAQVLYSYTSLWFAP